MGWQGHRATFVCANDGSTARARRYLGFVQRAPVCPRCRTPMGLADTAGLTDRARENLAAAHEAQKAAARLATQPPEQGQ